MFIGNKKGEEEITSLPAISIVMVGMGIFFASMANLYLVHEEKVKKTEYFEISHFIMEKMVSEESPLTVSFLILDIKNIENTNLDDLINYCDTSPYSYNLSLYMGESRIKSWGPPPHGLAISRYVDIRDEGGIREGKIVLWVWKKHE